jgi:hypothetical protein
MMKKINLILLVLLLATGVFGQTKDTIIKTSWYGRVMPVSLSTGSGYVQDKLMQNIEVGRSIGVIDIGVAYGRMSQRPDSTSFLEARITMDASNYGKICSEITLGGGVVFKSKTPIMLEISYTISYQFTKYWGLGVVTGYCDFGGNTRDISKNFFGIYSRFGLQRSDGGGLMGRMRGHHGK